jgi:23S rRNA (guanosine2251-2'-O)-methyltransferase
MARRRGLRHKQRNDDGDGSAMSDDDRRGPPRGGKGGAGRPFRGRPSFGPKGGGRPGFGQRRGPPGPRAPLPLDVTVLYGWHPVSEALRNPRRRFRKLMATENALIRVREEIGEPPLQPEIVRPGEIDRLLTPDAVHQGLYLECEPLPSPRLSTLGEQAVVLVLDQITDPHNVGAMLRSAAAFALDAVIVTTRHSPEATGVLAKAASGALEHVPIIEVKNLGDALEELGREGFLRVGLDSDGEKPFGETELRRPLALVLGAEGKGLRQKTRGLCDVLARLDMPGAIRSLNVSNATAIALYAAHQRLKA